MTPPRILIIAGSDSSGGAGIQADIKTVTMLGGYAMTAVTAITAQDTTGVHAVEVLSPKLVAAQIDACIGDIGVDAVKIGMLGSAAIAATVAQRLEGLGVPIVFDPVMVATSGGVLADAETTGAFERLIALATVTTPNLPELSALLGRNVPMEEIAIGDAACEIMEKTGGRAILAKGGHFSGGTIYGRQDSGEYYEYGTDSRVFDLLFCLTDGNWSEFCFDHPRVETVHTHGTGCTLASAIAAQLGRGKALPEAVDLASQFVYRALLSAPGFGHGHGPLGHAAVRLD